MRVTFLAAVVAMVLSAAAPARAQWTVYENIDPLTDEVTKVAVVQNSEGYRLNLFLGVDGVTANFSIPKELGQAPLYPRSVRHGMGALWLRVDELRPVEIESYHENWRVWSVVFSIKSEVVKDMMVGSSLLVRYPILTGETRDVRFSLTGARAAIIKAIDIDSLTREPLPDAMDSVLKTLEEIKRRPVKTDEMAKDRKRTPP